MFPVRNTEIVVSEEQEADYLIPFRRKGNKLHTWLNSKSITPLFGGQ
jgi:hypothetical protein